MKKLETRVNNISKEKDEDSRPNSRIKKFIKCKSCEERKVYCTHCNKCGKGGHKRRDCTAEEAEN